jgi:hypothetical protein
VIEDQTKSNSKGGDIASGAKALTIALGYDPEKAQRVVSGVIEDTTRAAASYITRTYGVSGEEVLAHIAEKPMDRGARASLINRVFQCQPSAFKEMVDSYRKAVKTAEYNAREAARTKGK